MLTHVKWCRVTLKENWYSMPLHYIETLKAKAVDSVVMKGIATKSFSSSNASNSLLVKRGISSGKAISNHMRARRRRRRAG